jgi:hypothetical protein
MFIKTQVVAEKVRTIMDLGALNATEEREALDFPGQLVDYWFCTGCRYEPTAAEAAILNEILGSKVLRWWKPVRP